MDIRQLHHHRDNQIADFLASFNLVDIMAPFCQHLRCQDRHTWCFVCQDCILCSRCDYFLGSDWRLFEMVGFRDPHKFSFDHFALWSRLLCHLTQCHEGYLKDQHAFPLALYTVTMDCINSMFQELKDLEAVPKVATRTLR